MLVALGEDNGERGRREGTGGGEGVTRGGNCEERDAGGTVTYEWGGKLWVRMMVGD